VSGKPQQLAGGRTTGAIISPLCRLRIALGVA